MGATTWALRDGGLSEMQATRDQYCPWGVGIIACRCFLRIAVIISIINGFAVLYGTIGELQWKQHVMFEDLIVVNQLRRTRSVWKYAAIFETDGSAIKGIRKLQ